MTSVVPAGGVVTPETAPSFPETYDAVRRVGRGSFGEVWQVVHRASGEERAAKILLSDDPALRQAFFHEYAMLFRLRHPGLVRTYEWGELGSGAPFFTMSWVDGPVLEGAALSLTQRLRALWELVDSLAFIHSQGLVHADLKPDNIRYREALLDTPLSGDAPRALCLLDFGLMLDRRPREGREGRGTVPYMAPEWFSAGQIDHRADLYSLGILIHSLFAGSPPFTADDPLVVVQKHLEATPSPLSERVADIPQDLDEAVARLLAKQPEVRDRGRDLLVRFLGDRLGAKPGAGPAVLACHEQTLGRYAQMIPAPLLDTWLNAKAPRAVFFIRGGEGLEQERVLEAIVPEIARYRLSYALVRDPADPRVSAGAQAANLAALVVAEDDTADHWAAYASAWLAGGPGPARLAIAVNADRSRQQRLTLDLARQARSGNAHVVSVSGLEEGTLHHLLGQAAPTIDPALRSDMAKRAAGNPARLFALAHDALAGGGDRPRFDALHAHQQSVIEASFPADERLAMCILACADVPVDRSVLRALADLPWSQLVSRWLEFGYVSTRAGRVRWRRRDLATALEAGLPEERRRMLHRAWAEYWGSFAPDPGSDEHQYLVTHALLSNAHRRAVRVGLEAARHWIDKHQADRGLEILERTAEALLRVSEPPPAWVYEQAVLTAEAQRVLARYAEAQRGLEQVLVHPAVRGRQRWEAEIYKRMGDLCKSLKQPAEGRRALEAALARYRELADKAEISHVLNNLGNIQCVAGDLEAALASYGEALDLQRQLERPRDIASTLNNIGGLMVLRSEYDEAVIRLTESVALERTLNNPEALARSLNNLSVAYVETGRYAEADTVLNESHRLNLAAGKTGEQLFNLENLAQVALARGEWSLAMSHCETGLKLCLATDSRQGRLPFVLVTARVALAQGTYEAAFSALAEAERLHRGSEPDIELAVRLARGEWELCSGRYEAAQAVGRSIVDLAQQEGLPSWGTRGYLQLAQAHRALAGQADTASRYLHKCLEMAEKTGALPEQIRSRTLLAEIDAAAGSLEQSAEHLRKVEKLVLECSSRPLFLPFSSALGAFYRRRGDLEMALSVYDTARKLASYLTMPDWTWRFLAASGHVLVDLKRHDHAASYYRGGVEILAALVERLPAGHREECLQERDKAALESGLRTCHETLVGQKNRPPERVASRQD